MESFCGGGEVSSNSSLEILKERLVSSALCISMSLIVKLAVARINLNSSSLPNFLSLN